MRPWRMGTNSGTRVSSCSSKRDIGRNVRLIPTRRPVLLGGSIREPPFPSMALGSSVVGATALIALISCVLVALTDNGFDSAAPISDPRRLRAQASTGAVHGARRHVRPSASIFSVVAPVLPAVFAAVLAATHTVRHHSSGTDHGSRTGDWGPDHAAASGTCRSKWHVDLLHLSQPTQARRVWLGSVSSRWR